jgi:DNA processing protein
MPLASSALEPLLRLAVVPGIGPARLQLLVRRFGSAERVFAAPASEVRALPGFGDELARRVREASGPVGAERTRTALAVLDREGAAVLSPDDRDYPDGFRLLSDPPFLVFAVGDLALLRAPAVALVGTRQPSAYGRDTAAGLSRELVRAGYVIVSGMASGIDAAAHGAALEAGGGTVGVLGNGIDRVYPAENRSLFRAVRERGLLLTEYVPGEQPKAGNFPRRNRLIAAIAAGVVVVEMAVRSGARHTVDAALELGREVFAVPGPIGSEVSAGTNLLIKQGAGVVTAVTDVLDALEGVGSTEAGGSSLRKAGAERPGRDPGGACRPDLPADAPAPDLRDLRPEEARLIHALDGDPRHVDELAARAETTTGQALALLLQLELRGLVESLPGKRFRRG